MMRQFQLFALILLWGVVSSTTSTFRPVVSTVQAPLGGHSFDADCLANNSCTFSLKLPVPVFDPDRYQASLNDSLTNLTGMVTGISNESVIISSANDTYFNWLQWWSTNVTALNDNIVTTKQELSMEGALIQQIEYDISKANDALICITSTYTQCSTLSTTPDPCGSIFCQNSGTCERNANGTGFCKCLPMFEGNFCENDILCSSVNSTCAHQSDCFNDGYKRTCLCKTGTTGSNCETFICNGGNQTTFLKITDQISPTYTIRNPGYPNFTYSDAVCSYYFEANAPGSSVMLNISVLQFNHLVCNASHLGPLALYDGNSTDSTLAYNSCSASSASSSVPSYPTTSAKAVIRWDQLNDLSAEFEAIVFQQNIACSTHVCQNGGTCTTETSDGSASCLCPNCVSGNNCEKHANICESSLGPALCVGQPGTTCNDDASAPTCYKCV